MGRARTTKPAKTEPPTVKQPTEPDETPKNAVETEREWLLTCDDGTELGVTRRKPEHAEGYLGTVVIDAGGFEGVLERIRTKWGGGGFLLQPKARQKNGRRLFASGSHRVTIAGEPMFEGRGYDSDGRLMPKPALPPTYPYPYPAPQPAQATPGDPMNSQMMAIVQAAMSRGEAHVDLAGVINALNQQRPPPVEVTAQNRNPYGDMRQMFEMMQLMRTQANADDPPSTSNSHDPMEKLMQLAALKFMGNTDKPAPPPPQQQQARSNGPATAQPSPNHVWHPSRGWVLWESRNSETHRPPAPDSSTEPEQSGGDPGVEDENYAEPIQPNELIGELEARTPEDRAKFLAEVMAMVEARPDLQSAFMGLASSAGSPAGDDEKPDLSAVPGQS